MLAFNSPTECLKEKTVKCREGLAENDALTVRSK